LPAAGKQSPAISNFFVSATKGRPETRIALRGRSRRCLSEIAPEGYSCTQKGRKSQRKCVEAVAGIGSKPMGLDVRS
jgi:hypothetical protein